MAIKGIVFDKDGVLVDFQKTYAPTTAEVIENLAGKDDTLAQNLADAVCFDRGNVSFQPDSVVIAGTASDIANAWAPLLSGWSLAPLTSEVERLYDDLTVKHVTAFCDVSSSLSALRECGLALALATNDTEESAHRHLSAIGEKASFDFIAGYNSGYGAKPGPGMILAFADHHRCSAQDLIMIGDSTHDMQAGRAAGAICIAVTTGLADRDALDPYADYVVNSLSELVTLVGTLSQT